MKIGDEVYIHGYVDEIRKDTIIIRNKGGYFGTNPSEVMVVNDTGQPLNLGKSSMEMPTPYKEDNK